MPPDAHCRLYSEEIGNYIFFISIFSVFINMLSTTVFETNIRTYKIRDMRDMWYIHIVYIIGIMRYRCISCRPVLWIRIWIRRIRIFLDLPDPDLYLYLYLYICTDPDPYPDPSIIKQI